MDHQRLLMRLAWLNIITHIVGLACAAWGMRPGSPLVELPQRMAYLASYPIGWVVGWSIWMVCVLTLIAFLVALARSIPEHPDITRLAVTVSVAGGTLDLFCDVIYITLLPMIASWGSSAERLFLTVERLTIGGGLVVANGMYSLSVLLFTISLRARPGAKPFVVLVGYGNFLFGMVMSVGGFFPTPRLAEMATGPTIGLYCVWTLLVGRLIQRSGSVA